MFRNRYFGMFLSFLGVFGIYLLYAQVLIPFVLPLNAESRDRPDLGFSAEIDERLRGLVAPLFPEDTWERKSGYIVQKDNIVFLFNQSKTIGNILEVEPCTALLLPEGEFQDEAERYRQAIIMQSSEKAILEFEGEFKPTGGTNANFLGGRLNGNVLVRSDMKAAGPDDDLVVEAREIVFNQSQITTESPINFRFGKSRGKGEWLFIFLTPSDPAHPKSAKTISKVELRKVHQLELNFPVNENGVVTKYERLEIRCDGAFEFAPDPDSDENWIAKFERNVEMMRINEGIYDHLTCMILKILLGPDPKLTEPALKNNVIGSISKLIPLKVSAFGQLGQPAKVRSPQNNDFLAEGDQLEYDVLRERITLDRVAGSSKTVRIASDGGKQWVNAQALSYTFGKDGLFGQLIVPGKGELCGESEFGGKKQPFKLDWSERLQALPDADDPKQICCKLFGTVHLQIEGLGKMSAKETTVWFNQKAPSPSANATAPTGTAVGSVGMQARGLDGTPLPTPVAQASVPADGNISSKLSGGFGALTPDRARIQKDVVFEAESGTCKVRQMEIWFYEEGVEGIAHMLSSFSEPPYANNVSPNATGPIRAGNSPQPAGGSPGKSNRTFLGNSSPDNSSRFELKGDMMRLLVKMRGNQAEIEQMWLGGNGEQVTLTEINPKVPSEPIRLTGTELHAWNPMSDRTIVSILGEPKKPAVFVGMESKLTGINMLMNQQTNRFQVKGPGQIETSRVELAQDTAASQSRSKPGEKNTLIVRWNGGMDFDGGRILFQQQVVAVYPMNILRCNTLTIFLDGTISFLNPKNIQNPTAKVVVCDGNVFVESTQMDGTVQKATMKAEGLEQIRIFPTTGGFDGTGPGRLRSTFRGGDMSIEVPGQAASPKPNPMELKYLDILFHEKIEGNFRNSEAAASGIVSCLYVPVPRWDTIVDQNSDPEKLKANDGFLLKCDRLEVAKMADPTTREEGFELTASGGTRIEGKQFYACAEAVKFNQLKNLASLLGSGTVDAEIHLQRTPGGEYDDPIPGQAIEYNIKTKEISTKGTRGAQFINR